MTSEKLKDAGRCWRGGMRRERGGAKGGRKVPEMGVWVNGAPVIPLTGAFGTLSPGASPGPFLVVLTLGSPGWIQKSAFSTRFCGQRQRPGLLRSTNLGPPLAPTGRGDVIWQAAGVERAASGHKGSQWRDGNGGTEPGWRRETLAWVGGSELLGQVYGVLVSTTNWQLPRTLPTSEQQGVCRLS